MSCIAIISLLLCIFWASASSLTDFFGLLQNARMHTTHKLIAIGNEWDIERFPKFLKSCQMHKASWFEMKLRFMKVIVASEILKQKPAGINLTELTNKFVISFTGSSVAAGHDSHISQSYPMVAGNLMQSSFANLNLNLLVRNVAHGNNPCFPYDPCVRTIAGDDSDMVHWEQSYNCFDLPMYEQFARQASFLPKKPIIIYSESHTSHWFVYIKILYNYIEYYVYNYRPDTRCADLPADSISKYKYTEEEKLLQNIYKSIHVSKNYLDSIINITYTGTSSNTTNTHRILNIKPKNKDVGSSSLSMHTHDVEETILTLLSDINKDELKNKVCVLYMNICDVYVYSYIYISLLYIYISLFLYVYVYIVASVKPVNDAV